MHPRLLLATASLCLSLVALTACQSAPQAQPTQESPVDQPIPALATSIIPSVVPTPTMAKLNLQPALEATPTPEPTATPTATPPPTSTPEPTVTPEPVASMASIWELDAGRVFSTTEDRITRADGEGRIGWRNKEPLILNACRLNISDKKTTRKQGHLFTHDGRFDKTNYLSMVLNEPVDGFTNGKCYEMAVKYMATKTECYYVSYFQFPSPYGECPKDALQQAVPRFSLMPSLSIESGKVTQDPDRPNARVIP